MLFLLGAMQLVVDGHKAALFTPEKSLALLGYLAAHRGMHSRRALAGLFWGDMAEERAQANLRMALYNLQKTLPAGYVQSDRKSVAFDPKGLVKLDSEQFEELLSTVHDLDNPTSLDTLDQAIQLYRGEFMAGVAIEHELAFAEWLYERRTWYHGRVLGALDALITTATRHSAWPRAITATRKLLALDPCREQAHRQLMHLLAQQGAYTAALEQYATCQTILHARMGLTPMPETDALYARISIARLRGPPPLPASTLPLVGREHELGLLYQYLVVAPLRLVTLLGPGGVGKTRIALATAAHQHYAWRDGVCFVPLANLTSGADLGQAIAEVLQLPLSGQRNPHEDLLNFLTNREMLMVLDNFEHVRDEGLALVEALLAAAPGVQLLVTSRERLSLSNEVCLKVEGLAYPLAQVDPAVTITTYSAIQLFLRLAHLEYADPPPSSELLAISQICYILEGLPLGIELAAGLTPHLNCTTIAALLEHDRDRLQSTLHDAPLRHQSLRTVFERSWERLDPFEQRSYRRLAIFSGSFTAEAARSVAGTSSYALDLFLGKSLLRTSDQGYYELHEMLRYYANEQLANDPEQGAVRMAHSSYYLKLLIASLDALAGPAPRDAVQQLGRQFANIRAAWHHAARGDTVTHLELAIEALLRYYVATSRFHEGDQPRPPATSASQPS
ncbi:AfsR/SARP family transcriptional regulator [Candidatus Chloroploca asiatica]|uniref:Bacterial transcriptional activator domain-containing protein n=1 Tax=Candidatus Chloroploca asiatica TaxID=1506545 RepID=A0A2H3KJE8_9CHLR|nr:BTAD domain-containing putative transcriptional regulator [Candidatus Chloroploca asiatica]PDV98043.1 hypothetical protein A9Q02_02880 [Candidatus Chloroploca asiatica]